MKNVINQELAHGLKYLKAYGVRNGSLIYVNTQSISNSRMTRSVAVLIPVKTKRVNGNKTKLMIIDITHIVASMLNLKKNKDGNIILKGCGMDMHYWLVSKLAHEMGLELEKVTL